MLSNKALCFGTAFVMNFTNTVKKRCDVFKMNKISYKAAMSCHPLNSFFESEEEE